MANRFVGLLIEGDDEVAAAPAVQAAAPKAAPAAQPAAPKVQRAPKVTKADAEAGFRQQGQTQRSERPPRTDRPRSERPPRRTEGTVAVTEGADLPDSKPGARGEFRGNKNGGRGGRAANQAARGKREYDRHSATHKTSEKASNMTLGKAEKTDDAEPATVAELTQEKTEAVEEVEAPAKVEDDEDAKFKTLEQYKQSLLVQKPAYELPAARVANEGQDSFKNQVLVTRVEEEALFAKKETAKKAAVAKDRKVVQTINVEFKPLLDSRRSEAPRSEGRGGFAGRGRGGRTPGAAPANSTPRPRSNNAAVPNVNDQSAFPSLK